MPSFQTSLPDNCENGGVIKIQGRSGCRLSFNRKQPNIIIKSSSSTRYNDRLELQKIKQESFLNDYCFANFSAPQVHTSSINSSELFEFEMEYIKGESYSDYLLRIGKHDIDVLISSYKDFFVFLLGLSTDSVPEKTIIIDKVSDICSKLTCDNKYNTVVDNTAHFLMNSIPCTPLPMGFCHGDFTLSNIIISSNIIYLIDFLDSFIDSPVIDLVKLRQDTKFHWSLQLESNMPGYKSSKLKQTLTYLDNQIECWLEEANYFNGWYKYLEVMNLFRILPYLDKVEEITFVNNCIRRVL